MTKPETAWDAVQADPAYQAALVAVREAREVERQARGEALQAMRTIGSLMLAASAAFDRMAQLEGVSDDQSETLETLTGDCSGCWFERWSTAEDDAQDAAMTATLLAAQAVSRYQSAKRAAEAASAAVKAASDAARAAFAAEA